VVTHSETTMSTSDNADERRQAIWPWVLMPIVVLLVFWTLQRFQDSAKSAAAQASQSHATDTPDTAEP
jgi:hypothetical protein